MMLERAKPGLRARRIAQAGMTLIEVLIAVAILAMVAASVLALISQNSRFMAAAEARLLAGIAADNLMVESLARKAPLERGERQGQVELGGRHWDYRVSVVEPGVDGLVRIEIAVQAQNSAQTLGSATTLKRER